MAKQIVLKIVKGIVIFLVSILLFMLFQIIAVLLPNERIVENVEKSLELFPKDSFYQTPILGTYGLFGETFKMDDYTDTVILGTALDKYSEQGVGVLQRAVLNGRYFDVDGGPVRNLKDAIAEDKEANEEYTRYWMGTCSFVTPLLLFFTLQEIRYFNILFVTILVFFVFHLLVKKLDIRYAFAYMISIMLMGLTIIPASLQYLPVFLITLISTSLILVLNDNTKFRKNIGYYFFITGIITAYFDLLTYPLITVGIPAIVWLLLEGKEKKNTDSKNTLFSIIGFFESWGLGYGLSYFAKWVLASIILRKNVISVAWNQFLFRADAYGSLNVSKLEILSCNFHIYFNNLVLILLAIYSIAIILFIIKRRKINNKNLIVPLLIIAISPYVWYLILSNHSYIHSFMTFRIQAITLFAYLSMTLKFIEGEVVKKHSIKLLNNTN